MTRETVVIDTPLSLATSSMEIVLEGVVFFRTVNYKDRYLKIRYWNPEFYFTVSPIVISAASFFISHAEMSCLTWMTSISAILLFSL